MAGQSIIVSVLADTKQFSKAFRDLGSNTELDGLTSKIKTFGKVVAGVGIAAAGGLVVFGKQAVDSASQFEQAAGATDAIFKGSADTVKKWANGAADALGLSKNQYLESANVIGAQLKNMGVATDEVAGKTGGLMTMAADMAAQFGGSTSEAVEALSSLLRGETDPIERYGVSIRSADIEARKAEMGLKGLTGEADKNATQMALMSLLTDQTADSQGAFGRESDTLAGKQQRLSAKFENMKTVIGSALLPAFSELFGWVGDKLGPAMQSFGDWFTAEGIPAIKEFSDWFQTNVVPVLATFWDILVNQVIPALSDLLSWVKQNKDWLGAIAIAITAGVVAWKLYTGAIAAYKTIIAIAKAAQIAFNLALAANPIGIIITLVAALVAGLIYFFTQTELGKEIVATAWAGIQAAVEAVATWFTDVLLPWLQGVWDGLVAGWNATRDAVVGAWGWIQAKAEEIWGAIVSWFEDVGTNISSFFQGVWDFLKKVWAWTPLGMIITNWDKIMAWFRGLGEKIKGVFSAAGNWLRNAGTSIITGLFNGVTGAWSNVTNWLGRIKDNVMRALWGASSWLYSVGRDIIQGLIDGIGGMISRIASTISNVGRTITNGIKSFLGIRSPSRVMRQIGRWTTEGLELGILDEETGVKKAMTTIGKAIVGTNLGTAATSIYSKGTGAGGDMAPTYNITVQALVPTPDTGRVIVSAIEDFERMNGRR